MDLSSLVPFLLLFTPALLGVLTGFILQWAASRHANACTRREIVHGLYVELKQSRTRLSKLVGHTVPTARWEMAVNSGKGLLLKPKILDRISETYFALENYQYEIKLVRRFSESARASIGSRTHAAKAKLAEVRWQQAVEMQKNMVAELDALLKEDFWPDDSDT